MNKEVNIENQLKHLEFLCKGRIEKVRKHNDMVYTQVACPAKDEYSMPNQFELRSRNYIGEQGQNFEVKVSLNGFLKPFNYIDKNTHEQRSGVNASYVLNVIEA